MDFLHFKAVLFRRWVLIKRSWKTVLFTALATIFFDALAIFAQYLISTLTNEDVIPVTFKSYKGSENSIVLFVDEGQQMRSRSYIELLNQTYINDTKTVPTFYTNYEGISNYSNIKYIKEFSSIENINKWMYRIKEEKLSPQIVDFGLWFKDVENGEISLLYNSTTGFNSDATNSKLNGQVLLTRLRFSKFFHTNFVFSSTTLYKRTLDRIFGQIGPMLITGALISAIPLYISQPIIDIKGEVRSYMKSCTLSLFSYWAATFTVDFSFWTLNAIAAHAILVIFKVQAVLDNIVNILYAFIMCGPSFILFVYCCSFAFATADSASRQAFILICIILLIPIIIDIVRMKPNPIWLEWLITFYPPLIIQRILMAILQNLGSMSHDLKYYFQSEQHQAYFIMQFGQIPIWCIVLTIIEYVRQKMINGSARRSFGNYSEIFEENKKRHQFTQEAKEMEEKVKNSHTFAVRIENVSRLFFNTAGKPVTAVNSVSLGIDENSIFGFLGANGAGKTTLIKMITSLLPPSNGKIEINGVDIAEFNDPTLISICPQFNSHLCEEMTPMEHFYMYSLLHKLSKEQSKLRTEKLIHDLDLENFKNQPLRELSGGDVRKLSIALSFLGPAEIILLDEPTASLDPVARHHVHEIILSYKGQKTFMLCTHLLSEAEYLCDMISIMIKGCVYTCGSPQYLTQKFGTDFKIDLMLNDESEQSAAKADNFFLENLPKAVLSIVRPKARIYSIPAKELTLPDLFSVMQKGEEEDNGFSYFTCSSSSLERVFMELVHMSENDDVTFAQSQPPV